MIRLLILIRFRPNCFVWQDSWILVLSFPDTLLLVTDEKVYIPTDVRVAVVSGTQDFLSRPWKGYHQTPYWFFRPWLRGYR